MKSILFALAFFVTTVTAHGRGFDHGNAGDSFSAEFLFSGRDVLQRLEQMAERGQRLIDTEKLRDAMEKTTVVSEERVFLDGLERDAVNFPERKLIKLSRVRWRELRPSSETKARLTLVLHEFLWVAGIDDTNFAVSGPIIEELKVPPYSPGIWLNVPGLAFATAECTGRLADGAFVSVIVRTQGATKAPDSGEVRIERGGNRFGYRFNAAEISQFFEFDDKDANTATVGLSAFVQREFPITIRYNGPNHVDLDLREVLRARPRNWRAGANATRSLMRVWRGPGHGADSQFIIDAPVCSVWSEN